MINSKLFEYHLFLVTEYNLFENLSLEEDEYAVICEKRLEASLYEGGLVIILVIEFASSLQSLSESCRIAD